MDACLTSLACVAIDMGPLGCVLHNDVSDLTTAYDEPRVTHFVVNRECVSSSSPSKDVSPTTSTSVSTTGMSQKYFACVVLQARSYSGGLGAAAADV